jgi:hypothetical protein
MDRFRIVGFVAILLAALSLAPSYAHVLEAPPRLMQWSPALWREATVFNGQFRLFALVGGPVDVAAILACGALAATLRQRGAAGALALVFWLLALSGALGAAAYRILPARLTRLEQRGTLREDHATEREELEQKLFTGLSQQSDALKALARHLIFPYARAFLGPLALIASGRTRRAEEATLLARVHQLVGKRKSERLTAARELVEGAVALRVLGARRLLELALGAWLPAHLVLTVLFAGLLVLHVVAVRW